MNRNGLRLCGLRLWHLLLGGAILAVLLGLLVVNGLDWEYSDGFRAGTLTKFSKKGLLFKTFEGEMNMGGMSRTESGMVPTVFYFSAPNSEVREKLEKALLSGNRVKLHYRQVWVAGLSKGDTSYYIVGVEELNEK